LAPREDTMKIENEYETEKPREKWGPPTVRVIHRIKETKSHPQQGTAATGDGKYSYPDRPRTLGDTTPAEPHDDLHVTPKTTAPISVA